MLLADSRASFQIEGERPPRNRLERWGRAILQAGKNKLSLDEIVRLHSVLIEDTRFVQAGLRTDVCIAASSTTFWPSAASRRRAWCFPCHP